MTSSSAQTPELPSWLDQAPTSVVPPPVETRPQVLPLDQLSWEDFERLCLRLVKLEGVVEHCQLYGIRGQAQSGIDFYARDLTGNYVVYQCKHVRTLGPAHIRSAISHFLDGQWRDRAQTFVLCTTDSVTRVERAEEIEKQRGRLRPMGKTLLVWDREHISLKLKDCPSLVADFFGSAWADRFCSQPIGIAGSLPSVSRDVEHLTHEVAVGDAPRAMDYENRIRNFLTFYLGKLQRPVPFGGRDREIAQLDGWLEAADDCPYLVLCGPAGSGKSTLLVHWIERLSTRQDIAIVFFPISIRFRTNLADAMFSVLASRLAHLHGERVTNWDFSSDACRAMVGEYLRRPLPDGRRLLVVVDALDEAADWPPGPDVFPLQACEGLHILVAARPLAGTAGGQEWLHRLGWGEAQLGRVMDLPLLTFEGTLGVLQPSGLLGADDSESEKARTEIWRLTKGDPLLLGLHLGDLLHDQRPLKIKIEDLRQAPPGLDGYFRQWWQDQQALWAKTSPISERQTRVVLSVLSCALGPLRLADLLDLTSLTTDLDSWSLDALLQPLNRIVVGDGRADGYVFAHPQLGHYFYSQMSPQEQADWNRRFLAWGDKCLQELAAGHLAPRATPEYLVHYYGAHLERAEASCEKFLPLLTDAWRKAWIEARGSHWGFVRDVWRVWAAVTSHDNRRIGDGQPPEYTASLAACGLARAFAGACLGEVPPAVMAELVRRQAWSGERALTQIALASEWTYQVEALRLLVPLLERHELMSALAIAKNVAGLHGEVKGKIEARCVVASRLDARSQQDLWEEVLGIARRIDDEFHRAAMLARLVACWPMHERPASLIDDVLSLVEHVFSRRVPNQLITSWIGDALRDIAPYVDEPAIERALNVGARTVGGSQAAYVLGPLCERATELGRAGTVLELIRGADPWLKHSLLIDVAKHLPGHGERLLIAEAMSSPEHRSWLLQGLASNASEKVIPQVVALTRTLKDDFDKTRVLGELLPRVGNPERSELFAEALILASKIPEDYYVWHGRLHALVRLAPFMDSPSVAGLLASIRALDGKDRPRLLAHMVPFVEPQVRSAVIAEAISASAILEWWEWNEDGALRKLLPDAESDQLDDLVANSTAKDIAARAQALVALAPWLTHDQLDFALSAMSDTRPDSDGLGRLSPHLSPDLLEKALELAFSERQGSQPKELSAIFARLPSQLHDRVLSTIRETGSDAERAVRLAALLPVVDRARQWGLVQEALDAVGKLPEQGLDRRSVLEEVAPYISLDQYSLTIRLAEKSRWQEDRYLILASVLGRVPDPLLLPALDRAPRIRERFKRDSAIMRLAPRLASTGHPETALATLASMPGRMRSWRLEAYAETARKLPPQYLDQAVVLAKSITPRYDRASAVASIAVAEQAPERKNELISEVFSLVGRLKQAEAVRVLRVLFPTLPQQDRGPVLRQIAAVDNEQERLWAFSDLAPTLSLAELEHVLESVNGFTDSNDRARLRAELAGPIARSGDPAGALAAVEKIPPEEWLERAEGLAQAAPFLLDEQLQAALTMTIPVAMDRSVYGIGAEQVSADERWREQPLVLLAQRMAKMPPSALYPLLTFALEGLSALSLRHYLETLPALAPVFESLGGSSAVEEIAQLLIGIELAQPNPMF